MPPLNSRATRDLVKNANQIPGPRSLHRGIHYTQNRDMTSTYKKNAKKEHADHRDLLVHHQKINEDLQDVYARTAALHKDNMTMEERIEEGWRQFERIGGKRDGRGGGGSGGRGNPGAIKPVGYADHLAKVSSEKKDLRRRSADERMTHGETIDYGIGSALHAAKDKRVKLFQKRQLKREHMLRRMGDPTPLKQSGRYSIDSGTLRVFNKTIRKVKRHQAHDERISSVKDRRSGSRTMWDSRGGDENINRPSSGIVRYTREFDVGSRRSSSQQPPNKRRRM